jgi:hypothetical protein
MIQIRQAVQEWEKTDLFVAQQPAQMRNPVEEIILDAGAANQQGNGVNEDAHAGEHSSPRLVVVLRPVLWRSGVSKAALCQHSRVSANL